jgi:hypothetical protein
VRGDQRGDALGADHVAQQPHDLLASLGVQLAGRLVGQQHAGPDRQGAGDGYALLLPARQLTGPLPRVIGQPDEGQHQRHPFLAHACRHAGDAQRDPDVLRRRQHRQQAEGLEDIGHRLPPQPDAVLLAHRADIAPRHQDRTAVRGVEPADHVQQGGLAGAGPAAQRHELPLAHAERDAAQGGGRGGTAAVGAGHVPHVDHRCHAVPSALPSPFAA